MESDPHYGPALASLHHRHFGMIAREAAALLLAELGARGIAEGTVAELAVGSGILSRRLCDAGFAAWGVDVSPAMVELARALVPEAELAVGSLWDAALPRCVAVAAVGEALCYAADPRAGLDALGARLASIHAALEPGGILIFDVAGPGRSGPEGARTRIWRHGDGIIVLDEREDSRASELRRDLDVFAAVEPGLYRHGLERHVLRLYAPEAVEARLREVGFVVQRRSSYGETQLPGWHVFVATRGLGPSAAR